MERLKIAWFSELNLDGTKNKDSKSAYFSDLMLPLLREHLDIDCYYPQQGTVSNYPIYQLEQLDYQQKLSPYNLFFYHIEDNENNYWVRQQASRVPGIVYFHDFYLTTKTPIVSPGNRLEQSKSFKITTSNKLFSLSSEQFPNIAWRECSNSLLRVFSTQRNLNDYLSLYQTLLKGMGTRDKKAFYLPTTAAVFPTTREDKKNFFCYAGKIDVEYRAKKIIETISKIKEIKLLWLVEANERRAVNNLIEQHQATNIEIIEGYNPKQWEELLKISSGAILTAFSAYRDLEPYLTASLAAKVPAIVCNFGHGETFSSDLLYKINPGYNEQENLKTALEEIIKLGNNNPKAELANEYYREFSYPPTVLDNLLCILTRESNYLLNAARKRERYLIHGVLKNSPKQINAKRGLAN